MTEFKNSSEFVKALLMQEPTLNGPSFSEHRRKLLDRLAIAERRERRGRYIAIAVGILVFAVFLIVYAVAVLELGNAASWPDWTKYLVMLVIILLPFSVVLLTAIYFFRHRRELRRARDQVYRSALADLPRQIEVLRREVDELRRQLPAPSPPSEGKSDNQRAFTLLELLVVVAVLGIFAGLLFPALSQTKSQARLTQCKANLSQLGKALVMYEGEEEYGLLRRPCSPSWFDG
jgi:prepilin-type N-terminal cleavage/methylation domain-containing protein